MAKSKKIGRFEFGPYSYFVETMNFAPYRFLNPKKGKMIILFTTDLDFVTFYTEGIGLIIE